VCSSDLHHDGDTAFVALDDIPRLDQAKGVDLGRGKRALVPGGRLYPNYQITLPALARIASAR
jgi:hypothetical protein